jgi:exonuclease SbcD
MVGSHLFQGFDYVALGHLHGPQQVSKNIRYSGSLMAYSFGKEEKQEKSVTILDTTTLEQKIVPLPQLRSRMTLTGTFQELMEADDPEEIRDGYVRLEVTDSYVGMESIAAFREKYRNLLEITGKMIEREDGRITMTIEDFEQVSRDPEAVFSQYCRDILEEAPGDHRMELFREACAEVEKEMAEA